MRNAPKVLAVLGLLLTLSRVAGFASGTVGAGWQAAIFALFIGGMAFAMAYWTRTNDQTLTALAIFGLVLTVSADWLFNFADVYRFMLTAGTWTDVLLRLAGIAYALIPTLLFLIAGAMQGRIDKQPLPRSDRWVLKVGALLERQLDAVERRLPALPAQIGTANSAAEVTQIASPRRQNWDWRKLTPEAQRSYIGLTAPQIRAQNAGMPSDTARHWADYAEELAAGKR